MIRLFFFCLGAFLAAQGYSQEYQVRTFLPDAVSTGFIEYYTAFTPHADTLYFVRRKARWADFEDKTPGHIYQSIRKHGVWQTPSLAPFSGSYADGAPYISKDGRYFFFTSSRPYPGKQGSDADIWLMKWANGQWSTPAPLPGINSEGPEYSPVLTNSGRLYFASMRPGSLGQGDVYACDFDGILCENIQNLGPDINTSTGEWNVFVDPDETYMIFEASDRIPGKDFGDLYISFKKEGEWQKARYLEEMSSAGSDLAVRLSPDGKWLYFAQSHDGEVDIKQVSIEVIEKYRHR